MTDSEQRLIGIERAIEGLTDEKSLVGQPAYLAWLGLKLGDDVAWVKAETGLTLAQFIRSRMGDRLSLVAIGQDNNSLAAWPVGRDLRAQTSTAIGSGRPKYDRELWLAFAVPRHGKNRFYDPAEHRFYEADQPEGPTSLEINDELLRDEEDEYDVDSITEKVRAWLAAHQLDEKDFRQTLQARSVTQRTREEGQSLGSNALELVLAALDKRQRQTLVMPLDIVEALLRKRV